MLALYTALLYLSSISVVLSLKDHKNADLMPLLKFDYEKRLKTSNQNLSKRSVAASTGYQEFNFKNEISGYYLNISLGTPSQQIEVELNFEDSELQIMKKSNPHCIENNPVTTSTFKEEHTKTVIAVIYNTVTCEARSFETKRSKTYVDKITDLFGKFSDDVSPWFEFNYGTSTLKGNYAKDTLTIRNITMNDFIFLATNDSNYHESSLGLGPNVSEYSILKTNGTIYPNFLDRLVQEGHISHRLYSLYANDVRASSGSIIFGGIDHSKYQGDLFTVPMTKDNKYLNINNNRSSIYKLGLTITGTGLETIDSKNVSFVEYASTNYRLSPNDEMTWLPSPIFDQLMIQLNATKNKITNGTPTPYSHYIECPSNFQAFKTKLVFDIGGTLFKLPLYNLINYKDQEEGRCYLALDKAQGMNVGSLGSAFARSFYIVVDLDDMLLSFAPLQFNMIEEEEVEVLSAGLSTDLALLHSRSWKMEDDLISTINTDNIFTLSSVYEASFTYSGFDNEAASFPYNPLMSDILKGDITSTSSIKGMKNNFTSISKHDTSKNDGPIVNSVGLGIFAILTSFCLIFVV